MRLHQIDLNLLVVFEAIYSQNSITKASEILCLSQPAVSNALNRLRTIYDDPLFTRVAQQMQPTAKAQSMIAAVRQALTLISSSLDQSNSFDPALAEREFRLSMADVTEAIMLPPLIQALSEQAPKVQLQCYPIERNDLLREMAANKLDLAIDVPHGKNAQLRSLPLLEDHYVCVLRPDHPALRTTFDLPSYLSLKHLHISSRRQGLGHIDLQLQRLGLKRNIALRSCHYMLVRSLLLETDFAVSVPSRLAKQLDLAIVPLPFYVPMFSLSLYWHEQANKDASITWLRTLAQQLVTAE
ncbi:hypothetical protein AKN90_05750 [Thiopseudomonas alkaliphila]|nr:hypothetical protein AKN90_05750 [Thiopseudomonas alkaliphila]